MITEAQAFAHLEKMKNRDSRATTALEQLGGREPKTTLERIASNVPQDGVGSYAEASARVNAPRNKFRAVKTEINGIRFNSKGEAKRYLELLAELKAGFITDLVLQKRFALEVKGYKIGDYVADFVYMRDGVQIVEDFKGMKTPVYNIKKRLMLAIYGVAIFETGARKERK